MGNLSNLFISTSYQSLIHLGNDNTITPSLVELQDGLGNSIGVSVNSAGDLSISGSLTASLEEGYALVGGVGNETKAVPTSSFGSNVDLGPLNQFTASQDILNDTFATTGSNTFNGDQRITGSLNIQEANSEITLRNASGTGEVKITSGPDYITSFNDASLTGISVIGANYLSGSWGYVGNYTNVGIYNSNISATTAGDIRLVHGTNYNSFQSNRTNGTLSLKGDTITLNGSSSLDSGVKLIVKGQVIASGSLTASLQEGYVWVGDSNGKSKTIATSSFQTTIDTGSFVKFIYATSNPLQFEYDLGNGGTNSVTLVAPTIDSSSLVTTSSFNAYTASTDSALDSLEIFTASQESKDDTLGIYTSSVDTKFYTIETQSGSWDNTLLNQFTSSQETKNSNLATYTGSVNTQLTNLSTSQSIDNSKWNTLGSQSGSFVLESETGSFARTNVDNVFGGNQTFLNIQVNGTASIAYLESVTGSAKIIGDAFIILNNDTPAERYAGIIVQDSGSTQTTASFEFDGQTNDWFYDYTTDGGVTTDYGVALFGPEYSTKGNPTYLTNNRIPKSVGSHHLNDSSISDDGTTVSVGANLSVTGSIKSNGTLVLLDGALSQLNSFTSSQDLVNAALNSFTASQEGINTALNASTASQQISIDALNSFTASYTPTDLGPLNSFTASQEVLNSKFATTGSNTFEGTQTINGDLSVSNIITADKLVLTGGIGLDLIVTGSGTMTADLTIGPTGTGDRALLSQYGISNVNQATGDEIGFTNNGSNYGVSGWDGPSIYGNDPDDLYPALIGFQNKSDWTDGTISILKPLNVTGSVSISGNVTASLQQGYVWVGDVNGKTTTVATSSFGGGIDLTSLNAFTSSQQILNAQFADTGSNTFNGNQIVNGVVTQNVTAPADDTQSDFISVTGATINGHSYNYVNQGLVNYPGFGAGYSDAFITEYYDSLSYNYGAEFIVNGGRIGGTLTGYAGGLASFRIQDQYDGTTFGNFYADEVQIGEFAAGTNTRIGIGHTALPSLELKAADVNITGSVTISGSINNSVHTLSITSNTASIDASVGTTFVLSLVSGTNTRLEVSNTTYGQTLNLLVSQSSAGTGTLSFGENFYEPSGSFYSASAVANAKDIVTLATFVEPNVVYVASIKNLIV